MSDYSSYGSQSRSSSYSGRFSDMRGATQAPTSPPPRSSTYVATPNEIRGNDIIAEYLVKKKVPYILGYAGHGAIGLLDGIIKQTDRIRHIQPRIEQTAGFMADVYYRLHRRAARRLRFDRPRADEYDDSGRQRLLRRLRFFSPYRQRADDPGEHRRFAG